MHSLLPFGFSSVCSLVFPQLHRKCSFTFYLTDLHVIVVYGHANIIFQKNMVERVAQVGTPADDIQEQDDPHGGQANGALRSDLEQT